MGYGDGGYGDGGYGAEIADSTASGRASNSAWGWTPNESGAIGAFPSVRSSLRRPPTSGRAARQVDALMRQLLATIGAQTGAAPAGTAPPRAAAILRFLGPPAQNRDGRMSLPGVYG